MSKLTHAIRDAFCEFMHRKKISILILLLIFGAFLPYTVKSIKFLAEERLPDEFHLNKLALDIQDDLPPCGNIPELLRVAKAPFHYIGHGGQAVAFASEDDQYVLKFFLKKSFHGKKKYPFPKISHWIPSRRKASQERREKASLRSLRKALHSYVTAFEKLKEKTGLIALHLAATKEPLSIVTVLDQNGEKHEIDLARASFVFQKKAKLVREKLDSLPTKEDKLQALSSLSHFFEERARSGFIDIERSFMIESNYGFLGNQPIQLDVGNIEYLEELKNSPEEEIRRMQGLLHNWAEKL